MSSSIFTAHNDIYKGLNLPGITAADGIKKKNDGYANDIDTYEGEMTNNIYAADNGMTHLATGAQKWANLRDVIAQSIAFHKCIVQILSFVHVHSSLKIDYGSKFTMRLKDSKWATSSIKYFPPDKSNEGLGFRHAPDGKQIHKLDNRVMKVKSMCKVAVSIYPSQKEAATMLNSCLSPQTTYVMRLSQFTEK